MKSKTPTAKSCMLVVCLQIIVAALLFILYYRVQFWAHSAYEYHNFVRCGNDLDELDARWRKLEANRHAEATMVRNILKTEKRKCASVAFFISIFYTTCMTNGFWVLQVYPMMTAITQSLIVWYLQRGPLTEKAFRKPAFVTCLMSSLFMVSLNAVNLLTSSLCLSNVAVSHDSSGCGKASCGIEAISSLLATFTSATVAGFIVYAYMTRLRRLDHALQELKMRSESSSELDEISSRNMPFIAGANIKV
ncbi:unnamed protein product [Oikopleura dioica]|uniref:Transmembrane protein n=1 Tax=Oikopleura dioica TaxID=34765 RepID=E4XZW9_OIKDI|nr:unnamed protein product [Oikopleura dioica]